MSQARNKPTRAFVIPNPSSHPNQGMPYELKQGSVWTGIVIQDKEVEAMATDGRLYLVLEHSHAKKPIQSRVMIQSKSSKEI